MPVLQLYHPQGALDDARKKALAAKLTDALLRMEGNEKTAGGYGFATVLFTPVAEGDWWVGGRADETYVAPPGRFIARVSIPEGYMTQAHKTEVHEWVTAAVRSVVGNPAAAKQGGTIQVILEEVPEGDWAAGGRTISLASIAETVGLPKNGERYKWLEAYFAAKARQYAAAGYPAGTGGLLPRHS